jgi:endonuclease-3
VTKREKIKIVVEKLEAVYGKPRHISRFDPMEELISCILSQHTTDSNSFPAFMRLRERYRDWDEVSRADPEELASVIRSAGLANNKTKSIQACLKEIHRRQGEYSIDFLKEMKREDAMEWLMSLPGVGPKTASIVLCFSFGIDAIPVDTHVYRVGWRLGLYPKTTGEVKAHQILLKLVPPGLAFAFHVTFIQHGRQVCRAPIPLCERCVITEYCNWYKRGGPERRQQQLERVRRESAKKRAAKRKDL